MPASETEKYAHVTFFFNGGVEKQFDAEERHMIPSPKVATYDKQPKMSVQGVADKVAEVIRKKDHEFVMCNFAPPDMVGEYIFLTRFRLTSFTTIRLATQASSTPPSRPSHTPIRLSRPCTKRARRLATYCSSRPITGTRNR